MQSLTLYVLPEKLAVCQLAPDAPLPRALDGASFWCATRTSEELSLVMPEDALQSEWKSESGWRCIKVAGPLDFSLTGVLVSISEPLARAGISIFAISTYNTDYILLRASALDQAVLTLEAAGFHFSRE